jgi:hypothetical protein
MRIENWSLKIGYWQLKTTVQLPMTNFQFSIAFKGALSGAASILFELRPDIRGN